MAELAVTLPFEFNEDLHQYVVENELQPHVTGILEGMGIIDYEGVPAFKLERKTLIGDLVHRATHYIDQDGLSLDLAIGMAWDEQSERCQYYSVSIEDVEPYGSGYLLFRRQSGFVPQMIEKRHVARINGMLCGMQIDRAGLLSKKPTILDLKCCAAKEKSWPVQLAGYSLGLPKPPDVVRWERCVLWLKPDRTYQVLPGGRSKSDPVLERRDEETFLAALRIAHWKRENL